MQASKNVILAISAGVLLLAILLYPRYMKSANGLSLTDREQLAEAIDHDDVRAIEHQLNRGVDINGELISRCTPLMMAAVAGHADSTRCLLEHGADPNVQNRFGWTALGFAASQRHEDVVQLLVAHGADVNHADLAGDTPLILAARARAEPSVTILLDAGAKLSPRNRSGQTVVSIACEQRDLRLLWLLGDTCVRRNVGRAVRWGLGIDALPGAPCPRRKQ